MVKLLTVVSAALLGALSVVALPAPTEQNTSHFYFTYPNKDTVWGAGSKVYFNWLNAPHGHMRIKLVSAIGSHEDNTYTVTSRVGARRGNRLNQCDRLGRDLPCGHTYWQTPSDIAPGKYQAVAILDEDHNQIAYSEPFIVQSD